MMRWFRKPIESGVAEGVKAGLDRLMPPFLEKIMLLGRARGAQEARHLVASLPPQANRAEIEMALLDLQCRLTRRVEAEIGE